MAGKGDKPCPICPTKTSTDNDKKDSDELEKSVKSKTSKTTKEPPFKIKPTKTFLESPIKHLEIVETFERLQQQILQVSPKTLNNVIDTIEEKSGKSSALGFQNLCLKLSENSKPVNTFEISKNQDQMKIKNHVANISNTKKLESFPFRQIPREVPPNLSFPIRGGRNLLKRMEIPIAVAKFGAKAAVAGGLIYYTGLHGLWGTPEDSFNFVNHLGDVVVDRCGQIKRLLVASDDE